MENINMLLEADKLARKKIETETKTNFFVEASAGSGKTTALVSRMVALVESGVSVENICAITFTKAAAREFYRRFQRRLAERSTDPKVRKNRRDKCAEALKNIDLCFTGTIDSFCNMLVSEHPLEAGVPVDASIRTDSEMKMIYRREYRRVAAGEYGPVLLEKYRRFRDIHWYADGFFFDNIQRFMDTRSAKLCFESPKDIAFNENHPEKLKIIELLEYIAEHRDELCYIRNAANSDKANGKRLEAINAIGNLLPTLKGNWSDNIGDVLELLQRQKGKDESNYHRCVTLRPDLPDEFRYKFGEYIGTYIKEEFGKTGVTKHFLDFMIDGSPVHRLAELQHAVAVDFLDHFARDMADVLRRNGELSYFDYLLYLRDMLRDDAGKEGKLITHLRSRFSCYLIDEFQDTNPMQAEVFFYLTARNPDADWRKCVPIPGTLFIVGDPKQSIYRFRNADVSSFLDIKEMFADGVGEVLQLHRNFRSTPKLCGWFNGIFRNMLPEETEIQSKYNDIPTDDSEEQQTGSLNGAYCYDSHKEGGRSKKNDDAERLILLIDRLVGNPKYTVRGEEGEVRPVRYGDIMVITPAKTRLVDYLKAFAQEDIPVYVEGKTDFGSCGALVTAANIMGAIALHDDTVNLYSALRSPAFDVTESQLCGWKAKGHRLRIFPLPDGETSDDPVYAALKALNDLRDSVRGMTASAMLEHIAEKLELTVCCGSDNMEYLHYAAELLREEELAGNVCSQAQGVGFIADLMEPESQERCLSLKKSGDRVHLANRHKVKGLEAPVVILADPVKGGKPAGYRVEYTGTEPSRWCLSLKAKKGQAEYNTSTAGYIDKQQAEKEDFEAEVQRLLYVAATRARDALIVSRLMKNSAEADDSNPWLVFAENAEPINDIYDEEIETPPEENIPPDIEAVRRQAEAQCVFADRAASETASCDIRLPSQIRVPGQHEKDDRSEDPAAETVPETETAPAEEAAPAANTRSWVARRHAALLGTMVHRLMEVLVSSRGKIDTEALLSGMKQEHGLHAETGEQLLGLVREAAEKMQNGGYPQKGNVPQDILSELLAAEEVLCEVPFCLRSDDGAALTNGIIDLVYRKDDRWHIIDYKTSADKGDLNTQYASQLNAYCEAFRLLTGCEADAQVYHIDV